MPLLKNRLKKKLVMNTLWRRKRRQMRKRRTKRGRCWLIFFLLIWRKSGRDPWKGTESNPPRKVNLLLLLLMKVWFDWPYHIIWVYLSWWFVNSRISVWIQRDVRFQNWLGLFSKSVNVYESIVVEFYESFYDKADGSVKIIVDGFVLVLTESDLAKSLGMPWEGVYLYSKDS